MSLANKYKFYIQSVSIALTEVNPLIENFEYSYEIGDISRTLSKNIGSDIVLHKADYTLLKTIEDLLVCEAINFYIDVYCAGAWVRDFTALIKLRKCTWDLHRCSVKLGIESNDVVKCVDDKSEQTANLLSVPFLPAVYSFEGFVEQIICASAPFTNLPITNVIKQPNQTCITPGQGWTMLRNNLTNIVANGANFDFNAQTTWVRQRVNGGTMPVGSGWISLGLDWVRAVNTTIDNVNSYGSYSTPLINDILEVRTLDPVLSGATPTIFENGIYLSDAIDYLVNDAIPTCNYTIISDFFSINPDSTHSINTAYTNALATYNNLVIWKTADIKRPTAFEKSTRLTITLKELIENLKAMFNIEVSIYSVGVTNFFRLEHASYFDSTNGTDLTLQWQNVIQGNVYSYDAEKLPREERFYFSTQTDETGGTFDGYPIVYDANCSDAKTVIEHRAGLVYTNMGILTNNDTYPDNTIVIAACAVHSGLNYIISDTKLNDRLTWDNLQTFCHYYNRPFATGTVNGVAKTFVQSKSKTEEVEVVKVDPCNPIAVSALVKTKIGWGKVKSAKQDSKNAKWSLTLQH